MQILKSIFTGLTASNVLPLRWLRLPVLLATIGLSAVCIAVGAQAIRGTLHLERTLKAEAAAQNISVDFDMQDVRSLTDVLTVVAILLGSCSFVSVVTLSYDWATNHALAQRKHELNVPISTRTLLHQAIVLSFLTIWLLSLLIPTTIFVRRRSAKVVSNNVEMVAFTVDTRYWDYGFLRCLAAAPWFSFMAAAPASLLTFWAYCITRSGFTQTRRSEEIIDEVK